MASMAKLASLGGSVSMGIAEVLLERGLITSDHLAAAMELRKTEGLRLDRALVRLECIGEETLLRVMSEQLGVPMVDLTKVQIDVEALRSLPPRLVHRKGILPVKRENGVLVVATSDPFDLYAFDEIRLMTGLEIQPALAPEEDIQKLIKTHFGIGGETLDEMMSTDDLEVVQDSSTENEDLLEMAQEASVVKLVNEVFLEAVNERASDIHIEPYERGLSIRYRIDGVLHDVSVPASVSRFQAAIISRIKIMSNLNIAEKRLPQDGRIKLSVGGRQVDIRVSAIPMLFGEGIVMRLLDKSKVLYTLPELGMAQDTFTVFEKLIDRPHGIVLVTGPTGSGKTTTLYAALQAIVSPRIKVLTIEDPVEYHLDGVNQIQVNPKIGMTFARGLRAILRHDPDVVMIGEIRDLETAEAAIQAALTGHLVFSTLHTNDACSAATRLLDMGIEPFLVTSTVAASMAQRLVRSICPDCKQEYLPDLDKLPSDLKLEPGQKLYRGAGCRKCRGTGFYGRSGLYELMVADDDVREKIMARAQATEILKIAKAAGLRTIRDDGWIKVRQGVTTPEEVMRVAVV
jgi:general secretion pathway protein E/type IV pilus assembly protein PilB